MSFRINTNVTAMNAMRNLGSVGTEFSKAVTRLSTGYRVNNASDDPAGLIASESFRAQIAGIDQAMKNSQDAINYVKTADAALDEVNKLLRDARTLANASANSGTLTEEQKQANQNQMNSIVTSINNISKTTSYGTKKLLDGSAGTSATSTSAANVSKMSFSGQFNGSAITANSAVTVQVGTAATKGSVTGTSTFAASTSTVTAGNFTINGVTFTTGAQDTIEDVVNKINGSAEQTGVVATWTAGGAVTLTTKDYGSNSKINLVDSNSVIFSGGSTSAAGVNAVATVTVGGTAVDFNRGSGLSLSDNDGNTIQLTENGNLATAASSWGQVVVGNSTFQIGANANQTTSFSLGNFSASNLGSGPVAGKNMSNINLTVQSDTQDALKVIDQAIAEISSERAKIGNFQRNILESNIRSLGISKENLSASESSIRDIDVANEMTNLTKLQILQQSGISILSQANSAPQAVMSLLR